MTPEISFKVVTFGQTVKEHYTFIFFQACEWAESSKSCNLVGSECGRYFTILPANPGGIVGSFIDKFVCEWAKTVIFTMTLAIHCARPRMEANCRCDVSFERPLVTSRPRAWSYLARERKLWWKKFKIKRFPSGCDKIWDSRSIEGKDSLATDPQTVFWLVGTIFMGFMELRAGTVGFRVPSLPIFLTVSTTQNFKRR